MHCRLDLLAYHACIFPSVPANNTDPGVDIHCLESNIHPHDQLWGPQQTRSKRCYATFMQTVQSMVMQPRSIAGQYVSTHHTSMVVPGPT